MKSIVVVAAIVVGLYFIFFLNAVVTYAGGTPEDVQNHWMGITGMQIMSFSIFLVAPVHLFLVLKAMKQEIFDWTQALALFTVPYMLGATIQALIL
jgi:hypothetical protein